MAFGCQVLSRAFLFLGNVIMKCETIKNLKLLEIKTN